MLIAEDSPLLPPFIPQPNPAVSHEFFVHNVELRCERRDDIDTERFLRLLSLSLFLFSFCKDCMIYNVIQWETVSKKVRRRNECERWYIKISIEIRLLTVSLISSCHFSISYRMVSLLRDDSWWVSHGDFW